MPITEVPALPLDDDVKDLRLALVCYWGVSLAVYMHGVTKEIHKLVVASKAFEASPDVNPFAEDRVEHVYFDALVAAASGRAAERASSSTSSPARRQAGSTVSAWRRRSGTTSRRTRSASCG